MRIKLISSVVKKFEYILIITNNAKYLIHFPSFRITKFSFYNGQTYSEKPARTSRQKQVR